MTNYRPYIVTIGGGSGSGKTTFARRLKESLGNEHCHVLSQDSYYIDQSDRFDHDGGSVNFDHPNSIEFNLLAQHQVQLKKNVPVEVPVYDFSSHSRLEETIYVSPKPIIIVDGILVLSQPMIRAASDILIYMECDENLRFSRRLKRDVEERGRTPEGVQAQFYSQVKPMHDEFVETNKHHADITVTVDSFDDELIRISESLTEYIVSDEVE